MTIALKTRLGRASAYGASKIGLNGLMVHLQIAENDRLATEGDKGGAKIRYYVTAPGALKTSFSGYKEGLREPERGAEVVVRLLIDDEKKFGGGTYWEFEDEEMRIRPW
jgi:NAD(P)-dependent dehydrogenase (short-subunit alcohol dehydrogenase family)